MRSLQEALINKDNAANSSAYYISGSIQDIIKNESKYKDNYFIIPSNATKSKSDEETLKNEIEIIRSTYTHKEDAFTAFHDAWKVMYLLDYRLFSLLMKRLKDIRFEFYKYAKVFRCELSQKEIEDLFLHNYIKMMNEPDSCKFFYRIDAKI